MNQSKVVTSFGALTMLAGILSSAGNTGGTVNGQEAVVVRSGWLTNASAVILANVALLTVEIFGNEPEATNGTD